MTSYFATNHDWITALASVMSASFFALSILLAYIQIRRAVDLQKKSIAAQLWDTYLGRALQYPEFAYPNKFDFDGRKFGGCRREFERYEWFVSTLLRATDEILDEPSIEKHRSATALQNVRYHKAYLKWQYTQDRADYLKIVSPRLIAEIDKLIAEP
jgi:hypothetical protein